MSLYPPISRPCPYKAQLDTVMDGDFCRKCRRTVHDLTTLSDAERLALIARCDSTELCVRYVRPAAAVALVASTLLALPAAAQEADPTVSVATVQSFGPPTEIVVGGIRPSPEYYKELESQAKQRHDDASAEHDALPSTEPQISKEKL